jgi:hypothetical protein
MPYLRKEDKAAQMRRYRKRNSVTPVTLESNPVTPAPDKVTELIQGLEEISKHLSRPLWGK